MTDAIDPKMWASLLALEDASEPGFLRAVVAEFLETSPLRLRSIREAAMSADFAALERAAHTLKGSAGIIGAHLLAEHCARLEAIGHDGRPFEHEAALAVLEREWDAARAALLAALEKPRG